MKMKELLSRKQEVEGEEWIGDQEVGMEEVLQEKEEIFAITATRKDIMPKTVTNLLKDEKWRAKMVDVLSVMRKATRKLIALTEEILEMADTEVEEEEVEALQWEEEAAVGA